jgi:hypothetical protein
MDAIPESLEEVAILLRLNGIAPTDETLRAVASNLDLLASHYQNLVDLSLGSEDEPAFLYCP